MADVQFAEVSGVTKAIMDGRLDTVGVDALEIRFLSGIAAAGSAVIVDLSKVTYVASLGIRMLLTAARSVRNRGGQLAIFGASSTVMDIIHSTAISDVIPVSQSEAEALAIVKG